MAYISDYALSWSTAAGSPFALTMPIHATGDVLVALVDEDGVGTLAMTGWTQVGTTLSMSGAGNATAIFFKIAASAADTGSVTMGTPDAVSIIVLTLKDVDIATLATTAASGTGATATLTFATQPSAPYPVGTQITVAGVTPTGYNGTYITTACTTTTVSYASATTGAQTVAGTIKAQVDSFSQATFAAASAFSSASITTGTSDCLLIYANAGDGLAPQILSDPGPCHFINSSDSTGTTATTAAGIAAGWYVQRTAGATPTPSWSTQASIATNRHVIAFRNKTNGVIPAYIDDVTSPGAVITPGIFGTAAGTLNGITYTGSLPYANIGPAGTGKATTYDAVAATADYGINSYSNALANSAPITAATNAAGWVATFSASKNFSTGFVMGAVIAGTPKMANFGHGSIAQGGTYISFGDASNNYRSFQVLARDSSPNTEGRAVFSIQPAQTTTQFGYSATPVNAAAVTTMMFLTNCPNFATTLYGCEFHQVFTQIIAGGSSTAPVDRDGIVQVGSSFRLPVLQKMGAVGVLAYAPIQVGGGDAVDFQIDGGILQFPRRYNTVSKEINFHATDGNIGISYAGKSGDVIKHTNSIVTAIDSYYWEINSAATSAATWDFTGMKVIGATVTLKNVTTFANMAFDKCAPVSVVGLSIVMNNITFSSHTGNNALTLSSASESAAIDTCTFSNNTRAIKITAAGTYEFNGHIFSGNTYDIENSSAGAVIINNVNGSNASTFINTGGGSVTINTIRALVISGLTSGSRVAVISNNGTSTNYDDDTEIAGTISSGTSFTYEYNWTGTPVIVNIVIIHDSKGIIRYDNQSLGANGLALVLQPQTDRQYDNPT